MYPTEFNFWHSAFDPTSDFTYEFLSNFMDEMFGIFIDDNIHLGPFTLLFLSLLFVVCVESVKCGDVRAVGA